MRDDVQIREVREAKIRGPVYALNPDNRVERVLFCSVECSNTSHHVEPTGILGYLRTLSKDGITRMALNQLGCPTCALPIYPAALDVFAERG